MTTRVGPRDGEHITSPLTGRLQSEREDALAAARAALERATRLSRILMLLAEPAELDELAAKLMPTLAELFAADVVALVSTVGRPSRAVATFGLPADLGQFAAHVGPNATAALRTGRPVRVDARPGGGAWATLPGGPVIRSGVWLPVPGENGPAGVLSVLRCRPEPFSDQDVELLAATAKRLGFAFQQHHADDHAHTRHLRRIRLLDLATDIAAGLDFSTLAQRLVDGVTEVTDFRIATVTVRDGDRCTRLAASGLSKPEIGLITPYAEWAALLRPEFRRGRLSYLLPPGCGRTSWEVLPDLPERAGDNSWTAEHGLILMLLDDGGTPVGFLSVDDPRSGLLPSDETIEMLELFARHAQVALVNARLYEIARRQRDVAETLREVGEALSSSLDLHQVLKHCCDAVAAHSVAQRASVYLYDGDSGVFTPVMSRGIRDEVLWQRFLSLPPATAENMPCYGEAVRTGKPVILDDLTSGEQFRALEIEALDMRSAAVYPLTASDEVVGILVVDAFAEPVSFSADEIELMTQIAAQAAVGIRQARLHTEARDHAARTVELFEIAKTMTETFDVDTILDRIARAVHARMEISAVSVLQIDHGQISVLRSSAGAPEKLPFHRVHARNYPADVGAALLRDGTVIIADVAESPEMRGLVLPATRSLLIAGHGEDVVLTLALAVSSERPHAFTPNDAAFLRGLGQITALALRNASLYDQTRRAAERDSLTGLCNRRLFWMELDWQLRAATGERPTALAVIDVDDFKQVNDRHGHAVGDQLLRHVADRLLRSLRETDGVYRIGGEEFTMIMPATDEMQARAVLRRVAAAIRQSRTDLPTVSISAGIAVAPRDGLTGDELFRAADQAMYRAKDRGKDRIELVSAVLTPTTASAAPR